MRNVVFTRTGRNRAQEKRQLVILAKDFLLYDRDDVKEIINTFTDYEKSHRKLLKVYEQAYMS